MRGDTLWFEMLTLEKKFWFSKWVSMGSPSPRTHPPASHVLLLSQLYHSPSLRWEAMQLSLCLLPSFTLTFCLTHNIHFVDQFNVFVHVCVLRVWLCGCMHMCVYDIFLSFLGLRSHAIIFAFEDKAIQILPLSQTMTDFHFSSLEKLGTYISICLRPVYQTCCKRLPSPYIVH